MRPSRDRGACRFSRRGLGVDGQLNYADQFQVADNRVFLFSDDLYNGYFDRDTIRSWR